MIQCTNNWLPKGNKYKKFNAPAGGFLRDIWSGLQQS